MNILWLTFIYVGRQQTISGIEWELQHYTTWYYGKPAGLEVMNMNKHEDSLSAWSILKRKLKNFRNHKNRDAHWVYYVCTQVDFMCLRIQIGGLIVIQFLLYTIPCIRYTYKNITENKNYLKDIWIILVFFLLFMNLYFANLYTLYH